MTIPNLIADYQKKVFVTKVRYTYSLFLNVVQRSIAENGDIKFWDYGTSYNPNNVALFVQKYFEPYLHVLKHGVYNNIYYSEIKNGITVVWLFDGMSALGQPPGTIYLICSFNGNKTDMDDVSRDYAHIDFILEVEPESNKLDFFYWTKSGTGNTLREQVINHPMYGCNKNTQNNKLFNCGKLLQIDNFEIKEDYPW